MGKLFLAIIVFINSQPVFANIQHAYCTANEIEDSVCWQTTGLYLKTLSGLEQLEFISLDGESYELYANQNRSVIIQSKLGWPFFLVNIEGKKFVLQCENAKNGACK